MTELRYAVRRLRNSPTFSAAVLLVLAILIGATASIFALVDGVVFKPFDVEQASRLLVVWESSSARHMPQFAAATANYLDWQKQNTTFTDLAALHAAYYTLRTKTGPPERMTAAVVTPNYFHVLGVRPLAGRLPSADDNANEIVISAGYWRRSFGANPAVIGQAVDLDGEPKIIVGVVPPGASGIYDVFNTLQFTAADRANRDLHYLAVIGRLKPGLTQATAQQNLATVASRLAAAFPATNRDWTVQTVPIVDQLVGKVRPALVLLLVAGLCVLLVGAANLTNLFLVRGGARSHDLAVKAALGATRGRIARELATESIILALLGGASGFVLSITGVHTLKLLAPANLPRLDSVGVDARTALFCLVAAAAMILVFGLLPAHRLSAVGLGEIVREGARTGRSRRRVRLQDVLVVTQVFVSVVLLTTALLFLEAFDRFRRLNEGFHPEGVLTAEISMPRSRYDTPERQGAFGALVRQQLMGQPGVVDVTACATLPGMGAGNAAFYIVGKPVADPSHAPIASTNVVDGGYFSTLRIPLLRGRPFLSSDSWGSEKVVVVDQLLARRFFAGEDPVGHEVTLLGTTDTLRIVGASPLSLLRCLRSSPCCSGASVSMPCLRSASRSAGASSRSGSLSGRSVAQSLAA